MSSKKKNTKNRKIIISFIIYCICAVGGITAVGKILYESHFKKAVDYAQTEKESGNSINNFNKKLYEQQQENTKKQADKDYQDGESAVDSNYISNSDSEEGSIMCQDLYDSDGNLLWKGISPEEAENPSEEIKNQFEDAYEKWSASSGDVNEKTELEVSDSGPARNRLISLCYDYNECIPYAGEGFSYYKGYYKEENGFDNTEFVSLGQNGNGLCGIGYITWVMRNVFGHTPDALKKQQLNYDKMTEVSLSDLQAGDICINSTDEGMVCGIVAGFYDGSPVVSLCDNTCTGKFPCGVNHYVFIKSESDKYINEFAPVDFNKFFRIDEKWEE